MNLSDSNWIMISFRAYPLRGYTRLPIKQSLRDSTIVTIPCGARESEASDHKIVRHKCVQMTENDDENENNFVYLEFISNFADADRIPQRPGRGLT